MLMSVIFCGKATGGGAYKYADVFKERLGVSLEKEDEMDCLVAGANFLLKVPIILAIVYCASVLYTDIVMFIVDLWKCTELIHF